MSNVDVIEVPAPDLTKGMRVFRRDRFGNLKLDFTIGDPFTTSGPDRLQPIAFHTTNGIKAFSLCAVIEVGSGQTIKDKRPNGKARRQIRKNAKVS
jgi:hypothetical protein